VRSCRPERERRTSRPLEGDASFGNPQYPSLLRMPEGSADSGLRPSVSGTSRGLTASASRPCLRVAALRQRPLAENDGRHDPALWPVRMSCRSGRRRTRIRGRHIRFAVERPAISSRSVFAFTARSARPGFRNFSAAGMSMPGALERIDAPVIALHPRGSSLWRFV